jgi:iron complex outermembrane receptor protein
LIRASAFPGPLFTACLMLPGAVLAQRADENAVTAAQDAFGTTVGTQTVGLYSPENARGFSPRQAGNVRIEGLYFDQQTFEINSCMSSETTMRVGIAAQSYSFPAPTGVADLSLRVPGNRTLFSALLTRGPFDSATADLEAQLPVVPDKFAIDVCAGYRKNFSPDLVREGHATVLGTTLRWQPTLKTEIIPFWGYTGGGARRILPVVYTDGTIPLPDFRTQDLGVQDWTTWSWNQVNFGVIAKSALSDHWSLAAGIFHSSEHDPLGYDPYMTLLPHPPGYAEAVMDVAPPITNQSTSGELRLARAFSSGVHQRQLQFSVRGRTVEREFGGDSLSPPVIMPFNSQMQYPPPEVLFTPANHDSTRQLDLGVTFEEHWQGRGSFAVGVLNDHYRRTVKMASGATDVDATSPWLVNARLAVNAGAQLIFYGSYVQGLEDSSVAPVSADNRNEPPPATRTWQLDGGLRYAPFERMQLIFGAFEIHKPYFNTGIDNVYTQLGQLQYRGLESSVSYNNNGLTVLLGGVWLQPRVERVIPEPGATGDVPLGPVPLTFTVNLDYAPPQWGPWGASAQWNRLSSRVATTDNAIYLPALDTLAAGIRYHWTMRAKPWNLRLDAFNLTDSRGLHVSDLEVVLPEQGRRIMLTLATDQ